MSIAKLIKVAENEVGYLEKKDDNPKYLYDKKANAGRANVTKYWADLKPSYQGEPWCNAFVNWVFYKVYGLDNAHKLLCCDRFDYYTPTTAQFFKDKGQWYSTPKVGDVVYFKNSTRIHHVGIVVTVTHDHITTIEGNTSPQAGGEDVVANGGGVWGKTYSKKNGAIAGYGRPNYSTLCLNFVRRMYRQVLDREPDAGGESYWANGLASGSETGATIAKGFYLGPEYEAMKKSDKAFLTDCYHGLLGRNPDESGYRYWLKPLESGRLTRADVLKGFVDSAEYINQCWRFGIDKGVF